MREKLPFTAGAIILLWLVFFAALSANAQPQSPRPVPEYEPSESVIIRYNFNGNIWPLYQQLIMECQEAAATILLVNNESELQTLRSLLNNAGIPQDNIHILQIPASRMWVRDHGPLAIDTEDGKAFMNFIDYNNSGFNDQNLPVSLAQHWGLQHYSLDWILDGGNYMVDNYSTLFATTRLYTNNPGIPAGEIDQMLQQYMGINQVITVSPQHDDYWGHIDMQMKLLNDTTFVISSVENDSGPNYAVLEANVAIIESLTAPNGQPYTIARLPKADNWKTYTNALILNDKVIVPVYDHPNDQIALDIYSALMPDHTVVGIDCNSVIHWGGAIHCITMQIFYSPPELFELAVQISGQGNISVNGEDYSGPILIEEGSELILEAVGAHGYDFRGWFGDLSGNENPLTVLVEGNLDVSARFAPEVQPYAAFAEARGEIFETYQGAFFVRTDSVISTPGGDAFYFGPNVAEFNECFYPDIPAITGTHAFFDDHGNNMFFNQAGDTIFIKTHAAQGESWEMLRDDEIIVIAQVGGLSVQEVFNQPDSVKTLSMQVYDQEMNPVSHFLNNKTIKLSKDHGILETVCFYFFPNDNTVFLLAGLSNPAAGLQNITFTSVFDFQPGDELHVVTLDMDGYEPSYRYFRELMIKRILTRENINDSIRYTAERIIQTEQRDNPHQDLLTEFINDTISFTIKPREDFDKLARTPIYNEDMLYFYNQQGEEKYMIYPGLEPGDTDGCWTYPIYDGCNNTQVYRKGLGGPYYLCEWNFAVSERRLVYYKKDGQTWGSPLVITSVDEQPFREMVEVFPNPARGSFYFKIEQDMLPAEIELIDISGKTVLKINAQTPTGSVSIEGLPPGVYFYRITTRDKNRINGKLVVTGDR